MKKIVLLTNNPGIEKAFVKNGERRGFKLQETISKRNEIYTRFQSMKLKGELPELVFVTEGFDEAIGVPTWEMMLHLKKKYPELRIVYAVGEVEASDSNKMNILAQLVKGNIYDIMMGGSITEKDIFEKLDQPSSFKDVEKILEYDLTIDHQKLDKEFSNVFLFSSMKPGSGKTFAAVNVAAAIAKYGKKRRLKSGRLVKPRIAIVDGDLLNLSVGGMLRVDNLDKNMFTALNQIRKVVSEEGLYSLTDEEMQDVKNFVRSCLTRHKDMDNLYCMVSPCTDFNHLGEIHPAHFYFLMECLVKAFDVIIVDSNSSFDHQTTAAMYEMATKIYLLVDMDYNNLQNNIRYAKKLKESGYEEKLHYIINKHLHLDVLAECVNDLEYDINMLHRNGLVVETRIPFVAAAKMKALDYNADLLINDKDESTEQARIALLEIANQIWQLDKEKIEVDESGNRISKASKLRQFTEKLLNELNN